MQLDIVVSPPAIGVAYYKAKITTEEKALWAPFLPPCCLLQEIIATRYMKMSGATVNYLVFRNPDS